MPTRTETVTLVATDVVEIEGVSFHPGSYTATKTQIGVAQKGGTVEWLPPEYEIQLSEQQRSKFTGEPVNPNIVSTPYDATKAVATGKLVVSK
jgi:hypothetical protein